MREAIVLSGVVDYEREEEGQKGQGGRKVCGGIERHCQLMLRNLPPQLHLSKRHLMVTEQSVMKPEASALQNSFLNYSCSRSFILLSDITTATASIAHGIVKPSVRLTRVCRASFGIGPSVALG